MIRKGLIICFILGLGFLVKAQNYVYNGNFELYSSCPANQGQISNCPNWTSILGTSDYFNICASNSTGLNVPNTALGYERDYFNGNGFAGLYTFNKNFPNNGREYIQAELIDTLKASRKYLSTFYTNQCDEWNYAIASIGMCFSAASNLPQVNSGFINIPNAQIKNSILLNDTLNWLMVQDTFRAQGGEIYVTIGNFSYDSLSDTVKVYHTGFGTSNDNAYYYIDGVSVYDVTGGGCNSYWDAGYDKYILSGDSIRLGAINTDNSVYTWQNSAGGSTYLSSNADARPWSQPTVTTTYYVTKTCPDNSVFKDTVTVHVKQLSGIRNQAASNRNQVMVWPNPARDKIYIEAQAEAMEAHISNLLGKEILVSREKEIDVSGLVDGIYFLETFTGKKDYIQKLIVQH